MNDSDLITEPQEVEQLAFSYFEGDKHIYKSNNLIESSYNLSINADRLISLAIKKLRPMYIKSNLKPSQLETLASTMKFDDIKIYATEFRRVYKIRGNYIYTSLINAAREIFDAKIQYCDSSTGEFVEKRWVTTCKYHEGEGYVSVKFNPELILDLLVFKNRFSSMLFDARASLKSFYHIKLYELLRKDLRFGERSFDLTLLKFKLAIHDSKYDEFKDFNKTIIKPAVKAINSKSDIVVTKIEQLKDGRKVVGLKFYIEGNSGYTKVLEEINDDTSIEEEEKDESLDYIRSIVHYPLTSKNISDIINATICGTKDNNVDKSFQEYLKEKTKIIDAYSKKHEINNYVAMLLKALREDWVVQGIDEVDTSNGFNNFKPREYDYDDLEKKLLGWDENSDDLDSKDNSDSGMDLNDALKNMRNKG